MSWIRIHFFPVRIQDPDPHHNLMDPKHSSRQKEKKTEREKRWGEEKSNQNLSISTESNQKKFKNNKLLKRFSLKI